MSALITGRLKDFSRVSSKNHKAVWLMFSIETRVVGRRCQGRRTYPRLGRAGAISDEPQCSVCPQHIASFGTKTMSNKAPSVPGLSDENSGRTQVTGPCPTHAGPSPSSNHTAGTAPESERRRKEKGRQ